jgi:hypothetical protein
MRRRKARIAGAFYVLVFVIGGFALVGGKVVAAAVSLLGIAAGPVLKVNPLPLFGLYCLLIGYLIVRSTYVPRFLGLLMMFGGVGWLTFLSPSLASQLSPFNFAPGILGEGSLTLWLLVGRVDQPRG